MKASLVTLLCMTALCLTTLAQTGSVPPGHQMLASPEKFADGHLAALDERVHLTPEQKPQYEALQNIEKDRYTN